MWGGGVCVGVCVSGGVGVGGCVWRRCRCVELGGRSEIVWTHTCPVVRPSRRKWASGARQEQIAETQGGCLRRRGRTMAFGRNIYLARRGPPLPLHRFARRVGRGGCGRGTRRRLCRTSRWPWQEVPVVVFHGKRNIRGMVPSANPAAYVILHVKKRRQRCKVEGGVEGTLPSIVNQELAPALLARAK